MLTNIFLLLLFLNMQPKYEIVRTNDSRLEELLKTGISIEKCLINSANIYHLKNGNFVIVPEVIGKYAILYYDRGTLDEHIKNRHFPLPGPELGEILEMERESIENINDSIGKYMRYVEKTFMCDTNLKNCSIDERITYLNNSVNNGKLTALSDFDLLAIGLYLDEIFRRETESGWYLISINTLNPYMAPSVMSKDGRKFSVSDRVFKSVKEEQYLNIPLFYRIEEANFLGFEPFSKESIDFINQKDW